MSNLLCLEGVCYKEENQEHGQILYLLGPVHFRPKVARPSQNRKYGIESASPVASQVFLAKRHIKRQSILEMSFLERTCPSVVVRSISVRASHSTFWPKTDTKIADTK